MPVGDAMRRCRARISSNSAPAGIADIQPREGLAPAGIAAIVGEEDGIAGRGERQRVAGIEGILGRPARAAMDVDDHRQRAASRRAAGARGLRARARLALPAKARTSGIGGEVLGHVAVQPVTGVHARFGACLEHDFRRRARRSRGRRRSPVLSGAGVMPRAKLLVPMIASSRSIQSTLPSSR